MPDIEIPFASSDSNTPVKVICRLRPSLAHEPENARKVVEVLDRTAIRITDPAKKLINRFDFSACYDDCSSQQEIFDNEVRDMVLGIFSGITASIFTFGCTGSGKTHTLQGSLSDPGLTPRAVREIFNHIGELKAQHGVSAKYIVTISCFEIWKDKVWDLLSEAGTSNTRDTGKGDLHIREATSGQVFVSNLRRIPLYTFADFERYYERAMRSRSTSSTKLNHASSRSHAVLNLNVTQLRGGRTLEGKCVLIDLAGSENNKKTGNDENRERMKESVEINQSLLALRKVVRSLNAGEARIPYRDSKLTRILSDCLGGHSVALVICNIAPSPYQYRDTMNTLNFGSLTRNVENKVFASDKEDVDPALATAFNPSPSFYQQSHLNKSAPQLATLSAPKSSPGTGGASPYPSMPKLASQPSLNLLLMPRPRKLPPDTLNLLPSGAGSSQGVEIPPRRHQPRVQASMSTKPLIIKKKPSSPGPRSFGKFIKQALDLDDAAYETSNSGNETSSMGDVENRVNELLQRNMAAMVEKRLDAMLAAKMKEAGLLDFGGPQTPRSISSNTSLMTSSERDNDLLERISHLEEQFQRENQRFIEHCSYGPAAVRHPDTFAKPAFKDAFTELIFSFLFRPLYFIVFVYSTLSFINFDTEVIFPFHILIHHNTFSEIVHLTFQSNSALVFSSTFQHPLLQDSYPKMFGIKRISLCISLRNFILFCKRACRRFCSLLIINEGPPPYIRRILRRSLHILSVFFELRTFGGN